MPPIILASSSPYRQSLLQQLGIEFECHSPDIDESALDGESPSALAARLAEQKAKAVAEHYPNALIIGSDQVASLDGNRLGKPGNHTNAFIQLQSCSGREVNFYTGLCLYNSATCKQQLSVETFSVVFRELSTVTIERYLNKEQPYDCAGSFKVEGLGISLFERLEGDDPNSLIGLPLIKLVTLLGNEGVLIP